MDSGGPPGGKTAGRGVFVFNGDADGICAQHIWELEGYVPVLRITGLKRDTRLLGRLPPGTEGSVYVFDIGLKQNRTELEALLRNPGVEVLWFDHHQPGPLPANPRLTTRISEAGHTCTGLLVDAYCRGKHPLWAAVAAFGDNLPQAAKARLKDLALSGDKVERLREMGFLINYNAYGEAPEDLYMHPLALAQALSPFGDPFRFLEETSIVADLRGQFAQDRALGGSQRPELDNDTALAFVLPGEAWARRTASSWANELALANPQRALAMAVKKSDGSYMVSIRAPAGAGEQAPSAADLAQEFPTGGGRRLAAGINSLPEAELKRFLHRFDRYFQR